MHSNVHSEVVALRASVRTLRHWVVILSAVWLVVPIAAFVAAQPEVLRVKGIVVEDAQGRARILIGAPVPVVAERIRTDPSKVREAWGARFGSMNWCFEKVRNEANGIVILDERGHDRVALGSPVPDPAIGARVAPSTGLVWNNDEGMERGGLGHLLNRDQGVDRSVLGLDNHSGEGAGIVAYADGKAGLFVNDATAKRRLFAGADPAGEEAYGDGQRRMGLFVQSQNQGVTYVGGGSRVVTVMPEPE